MPIKPTPNCPLCKAAPWAIEHLSHGWALDGRTRLQRHFCSSCGRVFALDEDGVCVHSGPTNHERPAAVLRRS